MPKILDKLKQKLIKQWKSEKSAYPIAVSILQKRWLLKPWTLELTQKWKRKQKSNK